MNRLLFAQKHKNNLHQGINSPTRTFTVPTNGVKKPQATQTKATTSGKNNSSTKSSDDIDKCGGIETKSPKGDGKQIDGHLNILANDRSFPTKSGTIDGHCFSKNNRVAKKYGARTGHNQGRHQSSNYRTGVRANLITPERHKVPTKTTNNYNYGTPKSNQGQHKSDNLHVIKQTPAPSKVHPKNVQWARIIPGRKPTKTNVAIEEPPSRSNKPLESITEYHQETANSDARSRVTENTQTLGRPNIIPAEDGHSIDDAITKLCNYHDTVTLSYVHDIDQLTFISGSLVDIGKTLQHGSTPGTFLFHNKISRVNTMKSSRLSFTIPEHATVFYHHQKRSNLPLHALKNIRLFDCSMHDINFSIYMVFFQVPVFGQINNYFTNHVYDRIIEDLNLGILSTHEDMRNNASGCDNNDFDHYEFSNMSSFTRAHDDHTRNGAKPSIKVTKTHRTTKCHPTIAVKYFECVMKILKEDKNEHYKNAKFVMTACDLKQQIKGDRKTMVFKSDYSNIPTNGSDIETTKVSMDTQLNDAIALGDSTMKSLIDKLFPYYSTASADIHLYFDYAITFKCDSVFSDTLTLLTEMDVIKSAIINSDNKTQTILVGEDEGSFVVAGDDDDNQLSSNNRTSNLMNTYMCVCNILKEAHALQNDLNGEQSSFSLGRTVSQSLYSSELFKSSCRKFWIARSPEEVGDTGSRFWTNLSKLSSSPNTALDSAHVSFDCQQLAAHWHSAMAIVHITINSDPSSWWMVLIIYLQLLLTCNNVELDNSLVVSLKKFLSVTYSATSTEKFFEFMHQFWGHIYTCQIKMHRLSRIQERDEIFTEMKIDDTHTDEGESQKPITFNQFYVQKCAKPNSGSCYGIFFSHKFGNFHTGNPVIRCIDLGGAVETHKLTPIQLIHPMHDGAIGYQFYTSPIKASIGRHEFNEWHLLPSLSTYISSLIHETGISPSYKTQQVSNVLELKKLIDYLDKNYVKNVKNKRFSTRIEFMMYYPKQSLIRHSDSIRLRTNINFSDMLHVIDHKSLCQFLKRQCNNYLRPLKKLLDFFEKINVSKDSEISRSTPDLTPECKTALLCCSIIISNEFYNQRQRCHKISCMNDSKKDPKGFSCVLTKYRKPLSALEQQMTGLQFGVDPCAFPFPDISQLSTLLMMKPIDMSKYIPSSVMADKRVMLETLRESTQRPISYQHYASLILSKLHSFSSADNASNKKNHHYFDRINYDGLRNISNDKQIELVKQLFLLVAECYRGDWREIIYSYHIRKKRESMITQPLDQATKSLFPTTVLQLNLYRSFDGNKSCMIRCAYVDKDDSTSTPLTKQTINNDEELLKNCFYNLDPEFEEKYKGFTHLTSRKLLLFALLHIGRMKPRFFDGSGPLFNNSTIVRLLAFAMNQYGRDKSDKSPSLYWRTKGSKMSHHIPQLFAYMFIGIRENVTITPLPIMYDNITDQKHPRTVPKKASDKNNNKQKICGRSIRHLYFRGLFNMKYRSNGKLRSTTYPIFLLSYYHYRNSAKFPDYGEELFGTALSMSVFYPGLESYKQATKNVIKKIKTDPNDDGYHSYSTCKPSDIDSEINKIKLAQVSGENQSERVYHQFNDLLGRGISEKLATAIKSLALEHDQWLSGLTANGNIPKTYRLEQFYPILASTLKRSNDAPGNISPTGVNKLSSRNEKFCAQPSITVDVRNEYVNRAFHIIQTVGSATTGGESTRDAPLYGEIMKQSLVVLHQMLADICNLTPSSILLDVGSGTGKPSTYFALNPGLKCSVGIECDRTRWVLSMQNAYILGCESIITNLPKMNAYFFLADFSDLTSFHHCTHIYSFTCG